MSRIAFVAAAALLLTQAWAATPYKIVTADQRGTYFAIGNDLAKMWRRGRTSTLEVLPTVGLRGERPAAALRARREARDRAGRRLPGIRRPRRRRATPRRRGSSGRCASSCRSTTPRSTTSRAPIRR